MQKKKVSAGVPILCKMCGTSFSSNDEDKENPFVCPMCMMRSRLNASSKDKEKEGENK